MKLSYDSTYKGLKIIAGERSFIWNVTQDSTYVVPVGSIYYLTGYYYVTTYTLDGVTYRETSYQTTNGNLFATQSEEGDDNGSFWRNLTTIPANAERVAISADSAKTTSYLSKLIENQKRIVSNNLFCAQYIDKMTAEQKEQLWGLQNRLQARDNEIKDYCTDVKTASPSGYNQFSSALTAFMATGGVGLVVTTSAIIVISAVVVASLATAAYFAFKAMYAESVQDVKFSDELTQTLMEKLTPEEWEQLKEETAGIVTKAKLSEKFKSSAKWIGFALAAAGGYILYNTIRNK